MSKIILNNSSTTPETPSSGKVTIYSGTDSVVRVLNSSGSITPITKSIFIANETQTSSTNGGTFTSGSYATRTINTILYNSITGASLSSNQITLPLGTYNIIARAPGLRVASHKAIIYNVTDSAVLLYGSTAYSDAANYYAQTDSVIIGIFTISSQKIIELRHRCTTTQATNGYGSAVTIGDSEIYSQISIEKIA